MQISFSDDAYDAYVRAVANIPAGYTVALLNDGEAIPAASRLVYDTDVQFVSADHEGVRYLLLDPLTSELVPGEPERVRPWDRIATVHVY